MAGERFDVQSFYFLTFYLACVSRVPIRTFTDKTIYLVSTVPSILARNTSTPIHLCNAIIINSKMIISVTSSTLRVQEDSVAAYTCTRCVGLPFIPEAVGLLF